MNYIDGIRDYINAEIEVLSKLDIESINDAMVLLENTLRKKGHIYIMGNGGSAATASHFQNDFNKGLSEHMEDKFRCICLSDNVPTITALANDIGYEYIYIEQLRGRLEKDDIVIAISGSGNSKNIIMAVEYARSQNVQIVGITGYDGGKLRELSDVSLHVPINSMQITEDVHMVFDHLMMAVFYKKLCGINHIKE